MTQPYCMNQFVILDYDSAQLHEPVWFVILDYDSALLHEPIYYTGTRL